MRLVLQTTSTIVLARLLTPDDFGLIAMVAVLVNFVALFTDAGLAQATVQRKTITHEQISTLFWINVLITTLLALIVVALAPVVVWIYSEPRLLWITILLAAPIWISGLGLQQRALLQRHMHFKQIARVEVIALFLGVILGILSARFGADYWSIVIMMLTVAATSTLGFWLETKWVPSRPQRYTGIRDMLHLGANVTGFTFVNYFSRNADNFLIGKYIGSAALGQYSRAYSLMMLPLSQINGPVTNAMLPALSRLKDQHADYQEFFLKWVKRMAWATCIPVASASIWGQEAITFLLGTEWTLAGEIFEWLAMASFLQPLASLTGVVLVSINQAGRLLRCGLVTGVLTVGAFIVGLQWGVIGIAMAYAAILIPICAFLPIYVFAKTPVGIRIYYKTICPPVLIGFALILYRLQNV